MKRIAILITVLLLATAGCGEPAGPKTTETADLPAPARPVSRLMPVATPTETTITTTAVVETPAPAPARTYTLAKGDSLWSVAVKIYGDGQRWKDIAQANNIDNPATLRVGQVLQIPQ